MMLRKFQLPISSSIGISDKKGLNWALNAFFSFEKHKLNWNKKNNNSKKKRDSRKESVFLQLWNIGLQFGNFM